MYDRLPRWCRGQESACQVEVVGVIPGWGQCPGGGHGNPLQYSGLGNPMDRSTCWARVHRAAKSWIYLSD